jgi:hypothetical protein
VLKRPGCRQLGTTARLQAAIADTRAGATGSCVN